MRSDFFVTDVAFASYKSYAPDYVFRQKKRKYEGVTLILSGEMEWIRDGKTFSLRSGDLLFQQINDTYQLKVVGKEPTEYMVISYLAEPMDQLRALLPSRIFHTPRLSKYKDLFEEAVRLNGSLAPCGGARLCAALQKILCCIIQEYARKNISPEGSYAENAMLFMEQNFALPIHCDLIAYEVGISASHLRALFKKEYGVSPQKYIVNLRIQNAVGLISTGYYSLKEVAYMSGYNDYKYFSVEFKKKTGVSPSEYRYDYEYDGPSGSPASLPKD